MSRSAPATVIDRRPTASAVVELLKPITWFAPMWAFGCGVVSSGVAVVEQWPLILAGIFLAGPLVCGTSQAVNDWFDREVDAVNEPGRPIPSGRIPGQWGLYIAILWTALSLALASVLGLWVFGAALLGLALAWAYSAPPLRLKLNGWWGNSAVAISYEGLAWFTGAAVMAAAFPDWRIVVLAVLYSVGAHGIMTLNDFKAVEGDRLMGVRSLPVQLGVDRAAQLCLCRYGAAADRGCCAAVRLGSPGPCRRGSCIAVGAVRAHAPPAEGPAKARALVQRYRYNALRLGHAGQRLCRALCPPGAVMSSASLGWIGIFRLGLVQTALGAIVVLTTSTLNRVMVVELALPAMLPGALVALHYAIQILRPRWGYGSDVGGRRTPWIIVGMAVLALGGVGAALATAWMASNAVAGIVLAVISFTLIGGGVGAAGTSLLVLLAVRVDAHRRAAAATVVWMMMIAGFVVTATIAGDFLDPFSSVRLVAVTAVVAAAAFALTLFAIWGVEGSAKGREAPSREAPVAAKPPFSVAFRQVWAEPEARRFSIFVFVSMLAYSAQDLILEPFAGTVFGLTPGQSTKLAGVQHGGVLIGMLLVAVACSVIGGRRFGSLRNWTIGGCVASAIALFALALGGVIGPGWPLRASVFVLGIANGAFAVAAIGSMMALVAKGRESREGVRMGLWGAAQAVAFGLGGFLGTVAIDLTRMLIASPAVAYGTVFAGEAALFLLSAVLAARIGGAAVPGTKHPVMTTTVAGNGYAVGSGGR